MTTSKRGKSKAKQASAPAKPEERIRVVAENRKAFHDYDLLERVEAGIVLTGTEIKSVRASRVNIRDAYAQTRDGEMMLHGLHISPWESGGPWNHDPTRSRKLLLHRQQIAKLSLVAAQQGLTIVPLRVYFKGHHAKVELALAKGRKQYDKRRAIMERDTSREIARALRQRG
ncbi:MAG: SsrA-binding protein SmpB [SAR202 cluster bacterium]|nr:SsrA-binding protein SmpB [SAR202 cluster bacterium]